MRDRKGDDLEKSVQEIVAILDLEATSDFHQRADKVRAFINDNSDHEIDEEFRANSGNPAAYAAGVVAYAKRLSPEPVHMECSTRSSLMESILEALGYETRRIAVFDSHHEKNLRSHSFLEVKNPETQQWETQDPDYDIYWRSMNSNNRVSLAEAAENMDAIEPCGRESCGWNHVSREKTNADKLKEYLDIIGVIENRGQLRYAMYTSRADLKRLYTNGSEQGTFCEVSPKRCRDGFYDISKR